MNTSSENRQAPVLDPVEMAERQGMAITENYYRDRLLGITPQIPAGWEVFSIRETDEDSGQYYWRSMIGRSLREIDDDIHIFILYDPEAEWGWEWKIGIAEIGAIFLKTGDEIGAIEFEAMVASHTVDDEEYDSEILKNLVDRELVENGHSPWYSAHYDSLHLAEKDEPFP